MLRLLRGETLAALARECGQPAGAISGWREDFLASGREGVKARPSPPEERELREAQRRIGEQTIESDTLDHLGIARSPAFHYEPETGAASFSVTRFTTKCLWIGSGAWRQNKR